MSILSIIVCYFAGMFALGFGLAFIIPLRLAMSGPVENRRPLNLWLLFADFLLYLRLGFPIFWLAREGALIWKRWPQAVAKWREDATVRRHFTIFLSAAALVAVFASLGAWFH